jgi:glycosyltransferase involved in cell wall biosynthesis
MQEVVERAEEFDIIHFHNDYLHFPFSRLSNYVHLTTLHGRLDLPDLQAIYKIYADIPVVSISDHQRLPLPNAGWVGTIYHGLPEELYNLGAGSGGYLAFLGRISPEKRPDRAIEIAIRAGLPIKIAAKVDNADQLYYEEVIRPLLDHPLVEFIGEIGEDRKGQFLGDAIALLFPIDWPEPFGMVMIEAMACGTPVIAFDCGSVPEVVTHGETGYIVRSVADAVSAVSSLYSFDRGHCRHVFEERFSARIMAQNYVAAYERCIAARRRSHPSLLAGTNHLLTTEVTY